MKLSKIILVLIGVIFLIQAPAFSESATLTDKQNGYSLRYPADWTAKTYPNSRDLVKGDISKGNEAGINIRLNPNHQDSLQGFVSWFVKDFKKQMENHWKGKMTTLDKGYYSIAGRKSFVITFDFKKENGERWIFKDYLVPKNDKEVFVFQGGVEYSKKDEYLPILDKIIKSLKIK
jgi:hypothetical protein